MTAVRPFVHRLLAPLLALLLGLLLPAGVHANCTLGAGNLASTPDADLTDNGDGTVTHSKTGLMWKQCSEGATWAAGSGPENRSCTAAVTYDWPTALTRAGTDNTATHTDWRLPTKAELRSIVETGCSGPAINTTRFPDTPSYYFWTSTPLDQGNAASAWVVFFDYGNDFNVNKGNGNGVRLVRGGQSVDTFDRLADYVPNTYSFTAVIGAAASAVVENLATDTVTVTGLTGLSTVTGIKISAGGQYAVDAGSGFGSYTSLPGVVKNGDKVKVRQTASASAGTLTAVTLTVGGVAAVFNVTTANSTADLSITKTDGVTSATPGGSVRLSVLAAMRSITA